MLVWKLSTLKQTHVPLTRHAGTLLLAAALLVGCSSQEPTPEPAVMTPLPTATQPAAAADTPTSAPATPDAGTAATTEPVMMPDTEAAVVENIDVRMMESFPVQAQAVLTGYLPDGCTTITGIEAVVEGTAFRIRMTTERPAGATCTMAVTPIEQVVSLDVADLPAGVYQVVVNDLTREFEIPESEAATQPQPGAYPVVETDTGYVLAQVDVPVTNAPLPDSAEIGLIAGGQTARVTGASPDGAWWRVICPDDTVGDCWVPADPAMTVPTTPPG